MGNLKNKDWMFPSNLPKIEFFDDEHGNVLTIGGKVVERTNNKYGVLATGFATVFDILEEHCQTTKGGWFRKKELSKKLLNVFDNNVNVQEAFLQYYSFYKFDGSDVPNVEFPSKEIEEELDVVFLTFYYGWVTTLVHDKL